MFEASSEQVKASSKAENVVKPGVDTDVIALYMVLYVCAFVHLKCFLFSVFSLVSSLFFYLFQKFTDLIWSSGKSLVFSFIECYLLSPCSDVLRWACILSVSDLYFAARYPRRTFLVIFLGEYWTCRGGALSPKFYNWYCRLLPGRIQFNS